ncbi:MAG: metal-dependent hydrolase [Nitrospinaceae bacterium]|nr:metal-dependent hydrolase [Nitrospinaceae bacterium]
MDYVDTHCHMVSRTTDDYEQMALTGCVAVTEPAFWAGYDRVSADVFKDYFNHLTDFEPKRAAQFGIRHFAWLCLNPKEGEDAGLTQEVIDLIPPYLDAPNVIGIGEIGFNRVTRKERDSFEKHIALAMEHDQLILIHTPHLEDKYKGTRHTVETLQADSRVNPARVLIDHAEEHTLEMILDNGFWGGITLYPKTKMSLGRAVDMVERFGCDRLCVNSACDWGPSTSLAVPHFIMEMRRRGHADAEIRRVVYENPVSFLGQCPKFSVENTLTGG